MTPTEARAVARLARRSAWRHPWRTGLIALLIAVAVAIAVFTAIVLRTTTPSEEQRIAAEFGTASLSIELNGYSDEASAWITNELATLTPNGSLVSIDILYHTIGEVVATDLVSPLVDGMFDILEGRTPGEGQVAVSWDIARRNGLGVGDPYEVPGFDAPLTVSAVVVVQSEASRRVIVVTPGNLGIVADEAADQRSPPSRVSRWLVGGDIDPASVASLFEADWSSVVSSFPPPSSVDPYGPGRSEVNVVNVDQLKQWSAFDVEDVTQKPSIISTLVAALLLAEIALLAAAAYATGIRRRLREIGLISAQGATSGQIRATVVGEAIVTGSIGALSGAFAALGMALVAQPIAQRIWNPLITHIRVSPSDLLGPMAIGVVAAVFAAWLPARTASRVPVLTALQGRMPSRQHPRWLTPASLVLVGVGLFLVVVARDARTTASSVQAVIGILMVIAGGALIGVPLVALAGRAAHLFPVIGRLVVRDSARQTIRAAAAITALMVVLTGTIAAATAMRTDEEMASATYGGSYGDPRFVYVQGDFFGGPTNPEDPREGEITSEQLREIEAIIPNAALFDVAVLPGTAVLAEIADRLRPMDGMEGLLDLYCLEDGGGERCTDSSTVNLNPAVVDPAMLDAMGLNEAQTMLESGVPVVLGNRRGSVEIVYESGRFNAEMVPVSTVSRSMPRLLLPEHWASERALIDQGRKATLFVNDAPLTDVERSRIYGLDFAVDVGFDGLGVTTTEGIGIMLAAALFATIVVIAIVTALSTTESDRDISLMVAIGAAPSLRRRFLGRQSAFYTASAALIAIPVGVLLMRVVSTNTVAWGSLGLWTGGIAVPWMAAAATLVVLPLIVGVSTALVVRSLPARPPRRAG
ncbi:MAG: ABC transporter permease [Actinomycetota bacterium]|nr:ABC transporter permease [Actinomycetota bacterium]